MDNVDNFDGMVVRHDPDLCMCPNLFKSIQRKAGVRAKKLDVTYHIKNGLTLRFVGYEQLGDDDLKNLYAVIALANQQKLEGSKSLVDAMQIKGDEQIGLQVKTSLSSIQKVFDKSCGGKALDNLKESLRRLASVTCFKVEKIGGKEKERVFRLLSFQNTDGSLNICLNPSLARAALGTIKFTLIDLNEVKQLKTSATVLIHARLCGFINKGSRTRVGMEKMLGYAWGDEEVNELTQQAEKYRENSVLLAVENLKAIGWQIECKNMVFTIYRPRQIVGM